MRICTYSDVPVSQQAFVEFLLADDVTESLRDSQSRLGEPRPRGLVDKAARRALE